MQLDAMVQVAPHRWINAISAAAIGAAPVDRTVRRVRPKPVWGNNDVVVRTISWGQFYALFGRQAPVRPAVAQKLHSAPHRPRTAASIAASLERLAAERNRVAALVASYAAYRAAMPMPVRYRGGYPLVRQVLKDNPGGAYSLMKAIRKVAPCQNLESFAPSFWMGDDDYEPGFSGGDELSIDQIHDVRPSIELMMSDLWRTRVTRMADGRVTRHVAGIDDTVWDHENERAVLAGMTFTVNHEAHRPAGGLMLTFASGDGKEKKPAYITRRPRGRYDKPRMDSGLRSYLSLQGFKADRAYVLEPQNLPAMLDSTPQSEAAQRNLDEWTANTKIMPPVQYCPTGVADGNIFLGGVKKPKKGVQFPADLWERDEPDLASLSETARRVVEEVGSRGNLKSLGVSFGYSAGYADRVGRRILDAATAEVMALIPPPPPANDNKKVVADVPFRAAWKR